MKICALSCLFCCFCPISSILSRIFHLVVWGKQNVFKPETMPRQKQKTHFGQLVLFTRRYNIQRKAFVLNCTGKSGILQFVSIFTTFHDAGRQVGDLAALSCVCRGCCPWPSVWCEWAIFVLAVNKIALPQHWGSVNVSSFWCETKIFAIFFKSRSLLILTLSWEGESHRLANPPPAEQSHRIPEPYASSVHSIFQTPCS